MVYEWASKMAWKHEFKESFHCPQSLSSQKIKSFSELNCLILKKIPWSTTCIFNKEFWLVLIVQSIPFKRDFFFSCSYFWKGIKRPWVSCCRGFLNTREGLSLCGSDFVKGILQSGKSQVGCLRTRRRHGKWPNQYKSSLHSSLILFIAIWL